MDWKQTVPSITFFYKIFRHCPGICYELIKYNNSRMVFKLIFENDTILHELNLTGDVEWPPTCTRNFETMQVNNWKKKFHLTCWLSHEVYTFHLCWCLIFIKWKCNQLLASQYPQCQFKILILSLYHSILRCTVVTHIKYNNILLHNVKHCTRLNR